MEREDDGRSGASAPSGSQGCAVAGKDNYGNLRQDFADRLSTLTDDAFVNEAQSRIWLSAYANNNPRSDYHWQADTCYREAERRGKPGLYQRAYARAGGR